MQKSHVQRRALPSEGVRETAHQWGATAHTYLPQSVGHVQTEEGSTA